MKLLENPLFKNLDQFLLSDIKNNVALKFVKAKEIIFDEEDFLNNVFYILKSGFVILTKLNNHGNETGLVIKYVGDEIGLLNAVGNMQTYTRATAVDDCELFVFNEKLTSKLLSSNNFTLNLLQKAFYKIRINQNSITSLSLNIASKKILFQILRISIFDKEKKIRTLHNKISQNHIASFSGVSRETVSREINNFKSLGILYLDNDKNVILDDLRAKKYLNN